MGIVFGLFVLVLLAAGLWSRRTQKKAWVAEERQEDSGAWIDKRVGERGTYGSLDALREAERFGLSRQGKINDLALVVRDFAFEQIGGFSTRSDEQIRAFTAQARAQAGQLIGAIDTLQAGRDAVAADAPDHKDPQVLALKKRVLDHCFEQFPALLKLEIDQIKQFDRLAAKLAADLIQQAGTDRVDRG